MEKYEKFGTLPQFIKGNPVYGDFASMPSFQEAFDIVAKAQDQFSKLSAKVRARFGNDPSNFLAFCGNPENKDEMRTMGLLKDHQTAQDAPRSKGSSHETGSPSPSSKVNPTPDPKAAGGAP